MRKDNDDTVQHYCKQCLYRIDWLKVNACPECGVIFDLNDPETWVDDPGVVRKETRKRVSAFSIFVIAIHVVFFIGVWLNKVGGLDHAGAVVVTFAQALSSLAVAGSIPFSVVRRFSFNCRQWDLYGPLCAVIGNVTIQFLLLEEPWWMPSFLIEVFV